MGWSWAGRAALQGTAYAAFKQMRSAVIKKEQPSVTSKQLTKCIGDE